MEDIFLWHFVFISCGMILFGIKIDKETFKEQRMNSLIFSLLTPFPIVLSLSFICLKFLLLV